MRKDDLADPSLFLSSSVLSDLVLYVRAPSVDLGAGAGERFTVVGEPLAVDDRSQDRRRFYL